MSKRRYNQLRVIGAWTLFGGFLLILLFMGDHAMAQTATDTFGLEQARQNTGLGSADLRTIVANIIRVALTLLGIVALVIFLYGGFLYLTSRGNEDQISRARKLMINGVIGIAIILSAYAITTFILSRLSAATGFNTGVAGAPGSQNCSSPAYAAANPALCGGGGFNPCVGNSAQGPFVVRSITPSAPNASAGHNNVGIRVLFNTSVNASFSPDQTFTILRDGTDVTGEFNFTYLNNSFRTVVEAVVNDLAGTGAPFQALPLTPGSYEVRVNPNLTNSNGGALQTNTQCGTFPLTTRFRVDPSDVQDVSPPVVGPITYNGMQYGGVIALPVGRQHLIESTITDDNGIGYVSVQINNITTPGASFTIYDGPLVSNGSASPYQFIYPLLLAANTQPGELYDVIITAVDTDHNGTTAQSQFITVGSMCQFGSGAGNDPSCRSNGPCSNNAQCLSGQCNLQTGQCVNLPTITDVSPWTAAGGNFVSIIGNAFGSAAGTVEFGVDTNNDGVLEWVPAALASCGQNVSTWNDGYIVVEVPRNDAALPDLSTSTIRVTTAAGGQFVDTTTNNRGPLAGPNQGYFTKDNSVRTPGLCQVTVDPGQQSPPGGTTGLPGDAVTAVGQSFTNSAVGNSLTFGGVQAQTSAWTDTQIAATVPTNMQPGQVGVQVTANGISSNGVPFTIANTNTVQAPVIEAISPTSTTPGSYVSALGQRFGNQTGIVYLVPNLTANCATGGCTQMNVTLPAACGDTWSDTQVVFAVPVGTAPGTYYVVVENSQGQVSSPSQTDQLDVVAGGARPSICSLSPSAGPAPLPASSQGLNITGVNFSNLPTVFFWGRGSSQGALGSWLQSAVTNPANANTTIQTVVGNDGLPVDVVNTSIPVQNGYSMQTGPILVQNAQGVNSNGVQYTVADCRDLDPAQIPGGSQCCSSGPDAGVIIPNNQICAGQPRDAGYVWRFTTGKIASVPYVIESCSNAGLPSPSPARLWRDGEDTCVNASIVVRFSLPMNITNATQPASVVRVLTCGSGPEPDCSPGNAIDITNQVQLVHQAGSQGSVLYLRQVPPAANMQANTWYHVEILDTLQSNEFVEVLGQNQVRNQPIVATKPCGAGTAYCFDFKTSAQANLCTLTNVGIEPPAFTTRRLGPVLDPRFPVDQNSPLNYHLWGQGSQACTALAVDGLGWQWATAGPNAIAARATVNPGANYTDSRAIADAFSNTAPQDVTIEARAAGSVTLNRPQVVLYDGLQSFGAASIGPVLAADPVSSIPDPNGDYAITTGNTGTTTITLRTRHPNESPINTANGWPAGPNNGVVIKTDTIILEGGAYRVWEQRFGRVGQNLPYRRLTRFSKMNNTPFITVNIDILPTANWATFINTNLANLTFPNGYNPSLTPSSYHIVQESLPNGGTIWRVPDTEFLDETEYQIVEDAQGCRMYWRNVVQNTQPALVGSCNNTNIRNLPYGPLVFGAGGNNAANVSRSFDYDGTITRFTVEKITPAQNQAAGLVASSSLIVDLGPPQVTSFFPDCAEACINANLGLNFSRQMDTNSYQTGIRLYRCPSEIGCDVANIANLTAVPISLQNQGNFSPDLVRFNPTSNLQANTWYLITAGYAAQMPSMEIDPNNPSVMRPSQTEFLLPFASRFRTKNDPTPCIASNVSVLPSPFTAFLIGEQTRYDAFPYGAPDACNLAGQELNPWGFGWQWQSLDTQVAQVSQFVTPAAPRPVCTSGCRPAGSDIHADAYPPGNVPGVCGNGTIDPGEDCDIADPNAPASCTLNCLDSADPDTGSSDTFDATNPTAAWCGSGTVTTGEDCEPGVNGDVLGVTCSANCLNLGTALSQAWCDANPTVLINNVQASQSPECAAAQSICGNGIVEAGEECEVIAGVVEVFDPNNVGQSITTNAPAGSCTTQCKLANICLTDVPLTFRCDPAQEGCSPGCTYRGSSPIAYSAPSLCGDGQVGLGEIAWCEYSAQQVAAYNPAGSNPTQVVTAVGQGTVTNGQQQTQIEATLSGVRVAPGQQQPTLNATIVGVGDYALQCGYTSFVGRSGSNLVLWLSGDGDSTDLAGSNDAIEHGGVSYAPGRFGDAFLFDGVDDYLEVPASVPLDFGSGDYTISLWHRTSEQNLQMNIFGRGPFTPGSPPAVGPPNTTEAILNRGAAQGPLAFIMYGATGAQTAQSSRIQQVTNDDQWYHVAYVRRGVNLELYINGILIGQSAFPDSRINMGAMFGSDQPWFFGIPMVSGSYFAGLMDEIQMYDRALNATEIQTLATSGAQPGSISAGAVTSGAGTGSQAVNTANARVNDCPDPRHGVGRNSCCYPRPTRTQEYPVDGSGLTAASAPVCRNTYISVTFDGEIEESTLFNNFSIARGYTAADNTTCSAQGLTDVGPELAPTLAFGQGVPPERPEGFWRSLWNSIKGFFASIFAPSASASQFRVPTVTNWCAGAVSAVPELTYTRDANNAIVSTTVSIYIDQLLDPNAIYAVLLRGGEAGIANVEGVGIGNPLPTGPITYDSFVFQTGQEVCKLDSIDVNPPTQLFNAPNQTHQFVATTQSTNGQQIVPITGVYDWTWSWTPANDTIFAVPAPPSPGNRPTIQIASQNVEGERTASAHATVNTDVSVQSNHIGRVFSDTTELRAIFCENPWPVAAYYPFQDAAGNRSAFDLVTNQFTGGTIPPISINGSPVQFNFSMGYCADAGVSGNTGDDLPYLRVSVPDASSQAAVHPTIPGGLRKYLLFSDINTDAIGIQIFQNPNHLPLSRWFTEEAGLGNPSGFQTVQIDGYQALANENNLYVNALNEDTAGNVYTNVYLFSINENANDDTRDVYQQLIQSLQFNVNVTDIGYCSNNGNINTANATASIECSTDFDCRNPDGSPIAGTGGVCANARTKLQRDWSRLARAASIQDRLATYQLANNTVPQLATGSFIPGQTVSRWASWGSLSDVIGGAAQDPVNEWSACGVCAQPSASGATRGCATDSDCGQGGSCQLLDSTSCWNAPTSEFVCPRVQSVTAYEATGVSSYQLHVPFEYLQLTNNFVQSVLPDPASVVTTPICVSPPAQQLQVISPFGGQSCGDGIVGPGEQCDPPGSSVLGTTTQLPNGTLGQCPLQNGTRQVAVATCDATCQWQYGQCQSGGTCGNGVVDGGEVCDDGALNGQYGQCNTSCSAVSTAFCGNGLVDTANVGGRTVQLEQCDIGQAQYQLGFCDKQSCQGTGRYQLSNTTPSVNALSGLGEMARTPNGTLHTIASVSSGGGQPVVVSETSGGAISQSSLPISTNDRAYTITFLDDQRGWVTLEVAGDGAIARTVDGGSSWSLVSIPTMAQNPVIAIAPATAQTIFAIGKRSLIQSTDGGGTWSAATTPAISQNETFNDIHFVDAQNGWIVGDGGLILRTTDGGASWQRVPSGVTVELNEVKFSSSLVGMIAARNTILRTTDGGSSWNQVTPAFPGFTYTDLDFADDNVWAFLPISESNGRGLQVTLDGGASWLTYGSGTQGYSVLHRDVLIVDPNTIQMTGSWSQNFGAYRPFRFTYATDPYCQAPTSCSASNACQNGDTCITTAAPLYHPLQANTCSYNCQSTGAYCGDGNVDAPYEQCDDANTNNADACTNICTINSSLPSVTNPGAGPRCGDGTVDSGEVCDLGNRNGIACIPGYDQSCTYCSADCQNILTVDAVAYCGNGQLEPQGGEICESLGNGQITTSTSGAVAQCSNVLTTFHSSLEIRGGFSCSNQCQTASNNCVICGVGGALSAPPNSPQPQTFNLPRPQFSVVNPIFGNTRSAQRDSWASQMEVTMSSIPLAGTSSQFEPRPWYRATPFSLDFDSPQFVFSPYQRSGVTIDPQLGSGIESDAQCQGFYRLYFHHPAPNQTYTPSDAYTAHFDNPQNPVTTDSRLGDYFQYSVDGEARGTLVYNEFVVVPPPQPRELRIVVRWTSAEDSQGNPQFVGNVYGQRVAGSASGNIYRYITPRANPNYGSPVGDSCTTYLYSGSSGYYVRDVNTCGGITIPGEGVTGGLSFHPVASLTDTFVQGTTFHTEVLPDNVPYAFFVEALGTVTDPNTGQPIPVPIANFDRSNITVEIYENRPNQTPETVYGPTQVFRITDASGTSNNPLARYWHPFNITRVGNSYTITPVNSIETGFSEVQCNLPGHPGC